jgi:hypothetical protein
VLGKIEVIVGVRVSIEVELMIPVVKILRDPEVIETDGP